MKTLLFLLCIGLIKFSNAQYFDTLGGRERKLLSDSARRPSLSTQTPYTFSLTDFNKNKSLINPHAGSLKIQLYSDPIYFRRNAFPVHPSAAESIFGTAAKITAQALLPNKRVF